MADLLEAHPETSIDTAWLDGCCVDCVEHETRSILSAAGTTSSKRQLAFDQATRFLASVPDRHALGREAADPHARQLGTRRRRHHPRRHSHPRGRKQPPRARPTPRDGDHHDARSLIGDVRLPTPAGDAPHALDAHERITTAYQALSAALPVFPDTAPPPPTHEGPTCLPDRSTR